MTQPALENGTHGVVFNIQRFSIQDGPGIRTTVFLKGCPLSCRWCSNPESQSPDQEILYRRQKCQSCGTCEKVCEKGAVAFDGQRPVLDRRRCDLCMDCVEACPGLALEVSGKRMHVEEAVEEAAKDEIFYRNSGGGVTLSGGEPLLQADFAREFLKRSKERSLSTALDTTGLAPWESLSSLLEFTDLVLFDLKHLDNVKHRDWTGVENDLILSNLRKTTALGKPRIWIRVPVIPGFNDSDDHFRKLVRFLQEIPFEKVSLLGYHEWGKSKYEALGRPYPLEEAQPLSDERLEHLKGILEAAGIVVTRDH